MFGLSRYAEGVSDQLASNFPLRQHSSDMSSKIGHCQGKGAKSDGIECLLAGRDLRAIFALLRKDIGGRIAQRPVLLLLRALTVMARHLGPTTFFNFANEGAGIMRNTPLRFPGVFLLTCNDQTFVHGGYIGASPFCHANDAKEPGMLVFSDATVWRCNFMTASHYREKAGQSVMLDMPCEVEPANLELHTLPCRRQGLYFCHLVAPGGCILPGRHCRQVSVQPDPALP